MCAVWTERPRSHLILADADPDIHFIIPLTNRQYSVTITWEPVLMMNWKKQWNKRGVIFVPYEYPKCEEKPRFIWKLFECT